MSCPEGVAKKALRGDDLGTPLAKNPFGSDGGRGRFAKDATKPQVTDILFSIEEIIHLAIVTVGALFVQHLAPLMPFLASDLLDGGADFFLYQPYRAYPKDLRYSLGLIHPRERFRRCSQ